MLQKNTFSPFRKPKLSYLRSLPFIFILALILFISTTNVYSAQVTLAWNPNTEPDLAGHKMYSGPSSRNYDKIDNVGNQTSYTMQNLVEGQTYYIALTAYDIFNNESGYSAEVVYTVPILDLTAPSTPTSLQATTISTSQINLSWNASSDNIGVTGYRIYRDNTQIATTSNTTYQDTGLSSSATYSYTVSAYDAAGNDSGQSSAYSSTTLSLPVNNYPVLYSITDITVNEGATVTINPTATDQDGDTLTFTYTGWMTSSSYTTNYNDSGTHAVTVTVSDGTLTDSQVVTVIVLNSNSAPVLDPITDITVNEGATITLSPTATDPDGDDLTYMYSGWMSSASYTTTYDDTGTHTVTVTVSDGSMSDSQVVTIIVNDTTSIATTITAGDIDGNGQDDVIIDYGTGSGSSLTDTFPSTGESVSLKTGSKYGIWVRMNDDTEVKLHDLSPETITTGDMDGNGQDDVVFDFGSGPDYGIWTFMNNNTWIQRHPFSPESVTIGDIDGNGQDDVIVDAGPYGIWTLMNNSTWIQLHTLSPESVTTGDIDGNGQDDVVFDFGSGPDYGIWTFMNNSTWTQLHPFSPESVATGDVDGNGQDDVIVDAGPYGIWTLMNNSTWIQLHTLSPESVTTGDIDGNGQDDVVFDFGSGPDYGIWTFVNNSTWTQRHPYSPESVTTGDIDGNGQADVIVDAGPDNGIWTLVNLSTWKSLVLN